MLIWLFQLVIILQFSGSCDTKNVIVASYNLWNVMFQWDVRKLYIAEMIQNANIDIIGFRDVRAMSDLQHTQLDDLQSILPEYEHKYYLPLRYITKDHLRPGWEYEGVGILSRHKILTTASMNLSIPYDSTDKNRKTILHAQFLIEPEKIEINVVLVQLSQHKITQCMNAYEIVKYIYNIGVESVVIMGDFKVDEEFNIPLKAIANGVFQPETLCEDIGEVFHQEQYQMHKYKFYDAWVETYPHLNGYTYSNLPVPGFITRPDRILVSSVGLKTKSAFIVGKGPFYAHKYGDQLHTNRYMKVLETARQGRLSKSQSSTCLIDCGTSAVCRCGICVSDTNMVTCAPGDCGECSSAKLLLFYMITFWLVPAFVYISTFFLLVVLDVFKPKWRRFLGRKLKARRLYSLPVLFIMTCIVVVLVIYGSVQFQDVTRLVNKQPVEALHPSNHLMVIARLEVL